MAKVWDDRLKRLFLINPQEFVHWLLPGAQFIDMVPLELKMPTRTVNADALCRVEVDGQKALLHIEFQKNIDYNMDRRVWDYNVRATLTHECPVFSFVIYLLAGGKVPESPLVWGLPGYGRIHVFEFTNIKLRDMSVDMFRNMGLRGLLPLCLLAWDGARREVGEEVFASLKGNNDLLNLALALASMVFTGEDDKQWLERKTDMLEEILEDTWYYERILEKGIERERERELQQKRHTMLEAIRSRFPEMVELVQQRIEQIHDSEALDKLIVKLLGARDIEEARQALHDIGEGS